MRNHRSYCEPTRIAKTPDPIDLETLRAAVPGCPQERAARYLTHLNEALLEFDITTPERIADFLAQVGHESVNFRYFTEIASGAAYDTGSLARKLGNTPEADGDGQRYKGRGAIQVTGTDNYRRVSKYFDVDFLAEPELLAEPEWAFRTAGWYWELHNLNELSDKGDFRRITYLINGGYNGEADRNQRRAVARKAFGL